MIDVVERTELLLPGPADALGALLDVPVPDLDGVGLPLLWHWLYLLDRPARADLGPDGHPVRRAVLEPPGAGRQRMFAGGGVRTYGSLRCGELATRRSVVRSLRETHGRSGRLIFAEVGHQIMQRGRIVVDEIQNIVYRDAASGSVDAPGASVMVPPTEAEWAIEISPTLLFCFSALTYNAHRIHYDRDYARDVEGYPGLLTHGPLQALAMAEAARALDSACQTFDYRLVAPLFDHQGMIVKAEPGPDSTMTSVRDVFGRQTATGVMRGASR